MQGPLVLSEFGSSKFGNIMVMDAELEARMNRVDGDGERLYFEWEEKWLVLEPFLSLRGYTLRRRYRRDWQPGEYPDIVDIWDSESMLQPGVSILMLI